MRNSGTIRLLGLSTVVGLSVLAAGGAAPAQGASFTVDAAHDAVDASPGDGVCADASGACTLRAAVMEANAVPGIHTIGFLVVPVVLTIPGAGEDAALTGDLDITDGLSFSGGTVHGGGLDRVFDIDPASTGGFQVGFNATTIRNGSTTAAGGTPDDRGGGILNRGSAALFSSQVVDNEAHRGGGIFNEGTFTTAGFPNYIRTNRALGTPASAGGGIYNEGTLDVSQSVIEGNSSARGGGVFNIGEADVRGGTTVNGNGAEVSGGGVYNEGTITISNSTIRSNIFDGLGNPGSDIMPGPFGTATVINSTFSGNVRSGIVNGGVLALDFVTIASNLGTGLGAGPLGSVNVKNTLIGQNAGDDCTPWPTTVSLGHNLDSDGTCQFSGPGDISNVDPKLGPLADNGGFGETHPHTHALLAGSPAIDAANNAGCPPEDQRFILRPLDGNGDGNAVCDIGAFEADVVSPTPVPPPAPTPVATAPPATPAILPGSGGRASSSNGTSVGALAVIGVAAVVIASGAVWHARRVRR